MLGLPGRRMGCPKRDVAIDAIVLGGDDEETATLLWVAGRETLGVA